METLHSSSDAEERLRVAVNAARIGVWEWDLATGRMNYSSIAKDICGFPQEVDVTIDMARAVTHPEDLPTTSATASRALDPQIRENAAYRYRVIRADTGEVRWVLAYGEARFAEIDGSLVATRYIGTIQDITEQHRAEEALAASEARLRLAIEAADIAVWELDLRTERVTGSPELNRLFGFPPEAIPTLDELRSRYAPGERERMQREGQEMFARGDTRMQTEFRLVWPDGTEKWLLLKAQVAPGSAGPAERALGVLIDVTERRRFEERLKTLVEELQHRVKNTLAVVTSIAQQSMRGSPEIQHAAKQFTARLQALGAATDLVLAGGEGRAGVRHVIDTIMAPYRTRGHDPVTVTGEDFVIPGRLANNLAMGLHELATNAAKYGALSVPQGRIDLVLSRSGAGGSIEWVERDGPAVVAPATAGFGTRLLTRGLLLAPHSVDLSFDPQGLRCTFTVNLM
jgi:PAS domain S-box-containing protein